MAACTVRTHVCKIGLYVGFILSGDTYDTVLVYGSSGLASLVLAARLTLTLTRPSLLGSMLTVSIKYTSARSTSQNRPFRSNLSSGPR